MIDLHSHLGSSTKPSLLWRLAHDKGLRLIQKDYFEFEESLSVKKNISHDEYVTTLFRQTQRIQAGPNAVQECIIAAVATNYIKFGVRQLELRMNPMFRNENMIDLDFIFLAACYGLQKAKIIYPVKVGLIIETDRSFSEEQTQILFEKAVKFKHMGIVGVDMSGHIPDNFKIDTYVKPFKYAKDNGLKITFHSGEIPGTEYEMGEMIEKISPNRIGHGIQATKNKEILDLVKKRDIHLEICPTSNLRTGCVKDLSEFGTMIKILKDNQISFSINTDGFAFFKTSITKEYELLLSNGILESKDVAYYTNEAKERSFINN